MNIILFVCTLLAVSSALADDYKIIHLRGKVSVQRNQKKIIPEKNFQLKKKDRIITDDNSIAIVKSDVMTIKVIENSNLSVSELEKEIKVNIKKGGAVINFVKNEVSKMLKKELKVKTSYSAVGVRGTTFFIYDLQDKTSYLSVKDGEVDFSGTKNKGIQRVGFGKSSFINNKLESEPAQKIGFEENINWELRNFQSELAQPKALFSQLEKRWDDYKKENEKKWNDNKKEMEDQWKKVRDEL